jgi:hypothetical protein
MRKGIAPELIIEAVITGFCWIAINSDSDRHDERVRELQLEVCKIGCVEPAEVKPAAAALGPEKPIALWKVVHTTSVTSRTCPSHLPTQLGRMILEGGTFTQLLRGSSTSVVP